MNGSERLLFACRHKTKYRSRMDAEPDLRLKLTLIDPDITGLCVQRQLHPSH